jgi:beta-carotene 3-hydroxylase
MASRGPGTATITQPHAAGSRANDLFGLVGAALSIGLFALGSPMLMGEHAWWPGTWIGLGVLGYGRSTRWSTTASSTSAGSATCPARLPPAAGSGASPSHATIGKGGGVSFGFVLAPDPAKLSVELRRQRDAGIVTLRESMGA